MRTKPTGVLVVAMFYFLSGAVSLAAMLWLLMASLDTSRIPFGGGELAKYILLVALIAATIGAGYLATGWGLWELKQWAQAAAIAVAGVALLFDLAGLMILSLGGSLVPIQLYLVQGLYAAVSLGIIAYLLTPGINAHFSSSDPSTFDTTCPRCLRPGILPGMAVCPFCRAALSGFSSAPAAAGAAVVAGPTSTLSTPRTDPDGPRLGTATTRVSAPTAPILGWLIVKSGPDAGKRVDLRQDVEIGRDLGCEVMLHDDYVSRQHARVKLEGNQFFIYDIGSRSGTFVNDRQVQRLMLYDGAEIRLGNSTLEFKRTRTH
jgi:hypothetical protein